MSSRLLSCLLLVLCSHYVLAMSNVDKSCTTDYSWFWRNEWAVYASGQLMCNGKPYPDAEVQLWDINIIWPNSFIALADADRTGSYEICGYHSEFIDINPYLKVEHNCANGTRRTSSCVFYFDWNPETKRYEKKLSTEATKRTRPSRRFELTKLIEC